MPVTTIAQQVILAPESDILFYQKSLYNPAHFDLDRNAEIKFGTKTYPGIDNSNFKSFFASPHIKISDWSNKLKHHVIGFNLASDLSGFYLSQSRVQIKYSIGFRINQSLYLGSGISLGMVNNQVKANAITGGHSQFTPDGNIGIAINYKTLIIGLASQQIFNARSQSISGREILFQRHYSMHFEKGLGTDRLRFWPGIFFNNIGTNFIRITTTMRGIYKSLFIGGLAYEYLNSLKIVAGIHKFPILKEHTIGTIISYSIPLSKEIGTNFRVLEVGINYSR